jgi:hypothetical protein
MMDFQAYLYKLGLSPRMVKHETVKEITPADFGSKLTIFRDPRQPPEAHDRLIEMLDLVGITGNVASTDKTPHELQWMVESGRRCSPVRQRCCPRGAAQQCSGKQSSEIYYQDFICTFTINFESVSVPSLLHTNSKSDHQLTCRVKLNVWTRFPVPLVGTVVTPLGLPVSITVTTEDPCGVET